jgi:3-hydroxy-3-methylglutaryl CoA synthase
MTYGILAAGAYIPRLRLSRRAIVEANAWSNPALKSQAKGERAMCNWDEDTVTMAVEASRDALAGRDRGSVSALHLCSTTLPFLDRLNAGVVARALGLDDAVSTLDIAATQRAATAALRTAIDTNARALIVAAENRRAKAGSSTEIFSGHGAAAILLGDGDPVAKPVARATITADFVDHYRSMESPFDYQWEERWIRDAGYMEIVPAVIRRCLAQAGVAAADVTHFCMPVWLPRVAPAVAKAVGIPEAALRDGLGERCGDTGAAHPLVLLVAALEDAKPGERILLVGFGQGADAILFECTAALTQQPGRLGVKGHLARRREELNYAKFLAFGDLIEIDRGMRAEADKLTPLSALWRHRDAVTSFQGGRCSACGTLQFPRTRICVNPNCNALDSQEPHAFADTIGRINSHTADRLTYSPDPPACYGMIQFEGGGRWMMDFTDVEADQLEVGRAMRMVFRIKDVDAQRGFRRYFWKAAPVTSEVQ